MITEDDLPILKQMLSIGIDEAARRSSADGWQLRMATVSTEWLGFGPVLVLPDANDPADSTQVDLPMQGLAGCDNYLAVGTRVMCVYVPPSGGYVIGRPNGSSDPWRPIGSFDTSAFGTGWSQDTTYTDVLAPSMKRVSGLVVFAGAVHRSSNNGSDLTLLKVPLSYAPKWRYRRSVRGYVAVGGPNQMVSLDVLPDGTITWAGGAVGASGADPTGQGTVFLDQLSFPLG